MTDPLTGRRQGAQVRITGPDGQEAIIAGPGCNYDRLCMSTDVKGIYSAPITAVRKSSAYQIGATYQGRRFLERKITFGAHLKGSDPIDYEQLEDFWFSLWCFEPDPWDPASTLTKMTVTSEQSSRWLWLARTDHSEIESRHDPHLRTKSLIPMPVVADQPFWEEPLFERSWETGASGTSTGFIEVYNPTPLEQFQKLVLTRGKWTIPDTSWIGPKKKRQPGGEHAWRAIELPELTSLHGGATVDWDPMHLPIRDFNQTNLTGHLNGNLPAFRIPPFTPKTLLPIKVDNAPPGGARAEIKIPMLWPRPWGENE